MSIADKLTTIAENEPKVYEAGQIALLKDSKYMNGKESGAIVSVNDVTPIEHNVGVKVASKNLFDISKLINTSNITNNQDGTLTIKANAIYSQLDSSNTLASLCPLLKVGDVATFSMITLSTYYKGMYLPTSKRMWQSGTALTITENDLQSRPVFYGFESSEEKYGTENIISNIQIESGTTATAYTPYVADLTGVEVARYGKNLFDIGSVSDYTTVSSTISIEGNILTGSIADPSAGMVWKQQAFHSGSYAISLVGNSARILVRCFDKDGNELTNKQISIGGGTYNSYYRGWYWDDNADAVITVPSSVAYWRLGFNFHGTVGSKGSASDIQVECGTSATEYEPYTETIYTANADGTVEGVKSISPNMTLIPNNNAVSVECEYLRDIDLYIDNLITNVALTGGE